MFDLEAGVLTKTSGAGHVVIRREEPIGGFFPLVRGFRVGVPGVLSRVFLGNRVFPKKSLFDLELKKPRVLPDDKLIVCFLPVEKRVLVLPRELLRASLEPLIVRPDVLPVEEILPCRVLFVRVMDLLTRPEELAAGLLEIVEFFVPRVLPDEPAEPPLPTFAKHTEMDKTTTNPDNTTLLIAFGVHMIFLLSGKIVFADRYN